MKGIALVCGIPHERFSELYWKLRPLYDRVDIDGPACWTAIVGQQELALSRDRLAGDYLTGKLGRGHLVCYEAFLAAAGLVFVLLFGNAGWALVGFTCAGAGLATIIPNTFAAAGNIEGSAPGPSLAVVTTAGYVGFLAGPPLIGLSRSFRPFALRYGYLWS